MSSVIQVQNLSKAYQLGEFSTGSIFQDIHRWWSIFRGKEDPFLVFDEVNDRTKKQESKTVWSLKDINFDVKQGEVFGIVGRNGAGKSTLLKLLSQVTNPTEGRIQIRGRIASLLEVGTGFHPELTGRDNVFLNGAILGMTKAEIRSKFDEIVAFSGIEKYIDTPVKRYSSGMYVRLAFAVAAHLEPEILIIDEVLAVGDADFQRKCMNKMKDVSGEGRTILFVSHNMSAINSLCDRVLHLENGRVAAIGTTAEIVNSYLAKDIKIQNIKIWRIEDRPGDSFVKLNSVRIINTKKELINAVYMHESFGIEVIYEVCQSGAHPIPNIHLLNQNGEHIFVSSAPENIIDFSRVGIYSIIAWIPSNLLNEGDFILGIATTTLSPLNVHFYEREAIVFSVIEDLRLRENDYKGKTPGPIRPKLQWQTF